MIQKTFTFFLLLICSMTLKGDIKNPSFDEFSNDNDAYDRSCHCKLRTRRLRIYDTATINSLDVLCSQAIGGNITVDGTASVGGSETILGDNIIENDLTVAGDIFITGSLIVNGVDLTNSITGADNMCSDTSTQLYLGKLDDQTLLFRCIEGGYNITLTPDEDSVTISTTSTVVVTPVLTTTVTGGVLGYAAAYNYNQDQTIVTGAPVLFHNPSGVFLGITEPAIDGSTFTIANPGTYYFEYHVRGTPGDLVPPAPLVFELRANGTAIAASNFASDTQIASLPSDLNGGTLATNGFVIATIPAGATTITLNNITGYDVILSASAQQGPSTGPAAVNASLIIERIA